MANTTTGQAKSIAWDGDNYKPREVSKKILPCPDTAALELAELRRGILDSRDTMRKLKLATCGDKEPCEASVLLFDGAIIHVKGKNIVELAKNVHARFSNLTLRWESVKLILDENATWTFPNRNQITLTQLTNGSETWTEFAIEGGAEAMKSAEPFIFGKSDGTQSRGVTPKQRIAWARKHFDHLPPLQDLIINTLNDPETIEMWCEFDDGKIKKCITTPEQAPARLGEMCIGRNMIRGGNKVVPRQRKHEIHPLKWARVAILDKLLSAEELVNRCANDSPEAQALALGLDLGLDLGMAIAKHDAMAHTPDSLRARDMNQAVAGAKPKRAQIEKRKHLLESLREWLAARPSLRKERNSDLTHWFWSHAETLPPSYKVFGDHRTGRIRHMQDKDGYSAQQLQKKLIPRLRLKIH